METDGTGSGHDDADHGEQAGCRRPSDGAGPPVRRPDRRRPARGVPPDARRGRLRRARPPSRADAAQELGWPHGTVASRLARGRALLARRLAKHGLVVSAGALAAALTHGTAGAQLPPALMLATVKAGTLLATGQAAAGLVSAHVTALTQGALQPRVLN